MPEACGVFGRDRELGAVTAFLDRLPSGPSGIMIEGEAGIGKTTVWAAGVAGASARPYLVLSSRPTASEAKLSFAALGDLMDGILERVLTELPVPQQDALQIALLLKDPAGRPLEHRAVCAAFLGVVRRLAAQSPVVIAIDDLQWLDRPSAMTLGYCLRRLAKEPVGLLASLRVGAGGQATRPAGAGLAEDRVRHLPIGPLAPADYEAAIRASASDRLSRLTIRRLFEASGGNLFYGLELARALGPDGN
jgi:predicted ATPase